LMGLRSKVDLFDLIGSSQSIVWEAYILGM